MLGACVTGLVGGFAAAERLAAEAHFLGRAAWVAEREMELLKADLLAGRIPPGPAGVSAKYTVSGMATPTLIVASAAADGSVRLVVECRSSGGRQYRLESFVFVPRLAAGPTVSPATGAAAVDPATRSAQPGAGARSATAAMSDDGRGAPAWAAPTVWVPDASVAPDGPAVASLTGGNLASGSGTVPPAIATGVSVQPEAVGLGRAVEPSGVNGASEASVASGQAGVAGMLSGETSTALPGRGAIAPVGEVASDHGNPLADPAAPSGGAGLTPVEASPPSEAGSPAPAMSGWSSGTASDGPAIPASLSHPIGGGS